MNVLLKPQNLSFHFDSISSVCYLTSEAVRGKCNIKMHYHILHIVIFIPFESLSSVKKCNNIVADIKHNSVLLTWFNIVAVARCSVNVDSELCEETGSFNKNKEQFSFFNYGFMCEI